MLVRTTSLLATTILLLGAAASVHSEEIRRDQVEQVMASCQADRQAYIEPLRQEEIERCISAKRGDRSYCERYNRDFGERSAHGGAALGWDLPSCQKADAAERYFSRNPGRKTFSWDAGR